ncbi:hypothetical protein BT93_E1797 [Corymbia citriodora subsp. variegata]|nr:hypothetical protein BT93_E1797 [Corymbia citriodora subsp. variegata]
MGLQQEETRLMKHEMQQDMQRQALDLDVLLEQWERTGLLAAELQRSLYVTCESCIMKINGGKACFAQP